jgi:hypothetical protein
LEVQQLPEPQQAAVLDFVELLALRGRAAEGVAARHEESESSLTEALRGMDGEPSLYTTADLRERF